MVTSIQNDYTNPNSAAAIQTAQQNEAVQKAEEMATAAESRVAATSKKGIVLQHNTDRVEISQEGVQASQTTQAPSSKMSPQAPAQQAPAQQAAVQATVTAEEEIAESVSSANTNLTSLSEQEIATLVQQGSVTQAQADKELARRTAQQTDDNDSNAQAANYVEE